MCSLNDDDCESDRDLVLSNSTEQLTIRDSSASAICRKCRIQEAEILLRINDGYCKECFLKHATHKFRAALGKRKIIRPNDSILVAFCGKVNSVVLLHLIKAAMHESAHKRLLLNVHIVYIDENSIEKCSIDTRRSKLREISMQIQSLGFSGYVTTLTEAVLREDSPHICPIDDYEMFNEESDVLDKTFAVLKDETARQELRWQLRRKLLVSVSRKLGCRKVFLADSSLNVATKILSDISLGRGANLSLDTGFIDERYPDVMLLRPLRDFTYKEIASYATCYNLNNLLKEDTDQINRRTSIQKLTKNFIRDLDNEHCGTVSAIFRTGEKLGSDTPPKEITMQNSCILCDGQLDTSLWDDDVSAIQATTFSRLMSNTDVDNKDKIQDSLCTDLAKNTSKTNCNNCSCSRNQSSDSLTFENVQKYLCYSCRSTFSNSDFENSLSDFVKLTLRKKLSLSHMEKEIHDFLL